MRAIALAAFAALATLAGVVLLFRSGLGSAGELLSGVAGVALIAAAILGFRYFWRRCV